jgi:beta-lactamase class A
LPAQIIVASSLVAAASEAMRAGDFLLCSAVQAPDLGLSWRPLASVPVTRGYRVSALTSEDADRVRGTFGPQVAQAMGGTATGGAGRRSGARVSAGRLLHELRNVLDDAGLYGSFLVRDLSTGEEIGIDPDAEFPIASLVKLPLAIAVLTLIADGHLDGATMIDVAPGQLTAPGPPGLGRFRHPARIAVDDLLYLSVAVSDNSAADALFDLVPPAEVDRIVRAAGITGIAVRHRLQELNRTPARQFSPRDVHLAHSLAIGARTPGGGHPVPQLDVSHANAGSARAFTDLLSALWVPARLPATVAGPARSLLSENLIRHRLAPDFASDASKWSSKTGSLLNLRHEAGVVEHDDGSTALTESRVPAAVQPAAEAVMAQVARALHDHLRAG